MEGPVVQILPRLRNVIFWESSPRAVLVRSRPIWGKWNRKEIKLINAIDIYIHMHMHTHTDTHTGLYKVLGKENWCIIYILSEMGLST